MMTIRALYAVLCLAPVSALAEDAAPLNHAHMMAPTQAAGAPTPTASGQAAFAAIQEIVSLLIANKDTDWSKVNIDALRQHLVDMDNVTLHATVRTLPVEGGQRFEVTGEGPVRDSIRRMVEAHAAMANGFHGWTFEALDIDGGAALTVHAPLKDEAMLKGLGFFGLLTLGAHHERHHLMIARGAMHNQ